MMFLAFLRQHWRLPAYVAVVILGVLVLTQGVEYFASWQKQRLLRREQTSATIEHFKQGRVSERARNNYVIDSVEQAVHRQIRLQQDSTLAAKDREISTSRAHWIELPVEPPVYCPNQPAPAPGSPPR